MLHTKEAGDVLKRKFVCPVKKGFQNIFCFLAELFAFGTRILKLCFKIVILRFKIAVLLFERRNLLREQRELRLKRVNYIFCMAAGGNDANNIFDRITRTHTTEFQPGEATPQRRNTWPEIFIVCQPFYPIKPTAPGLPQNPMTTRTDHFTCSTTSARQLWRKSGASQIAEPASKY